MPPESRLGYSWYIHLWTVPPSEKRIRAQTGGVSLMPANLKSQCNAPGGIAETRSDNISRRKENHIEKRWTSQNIITRHHSSTRREEATGASVRVWAFANTYWANPLQILRSKRTPLSVGQAARACAEKELSLASQENYVDTSLVLKVLITYFLKTFEQKWCLVVCYDTWSIPICMDIMRINLYFP